MFTNEDYLDNIFSSAYIHVDGDKRKETHLRDISSSADNLVNRLRNLKNEKKIKKRKKSHQQNRMNISDTSNVYSVNNNDISKSNPSRMDRDYIDLYQTKDINSNLSQLSLDYTNADNNKTKSKMKRSISLTDFGRPTFNEITVSDFPRWNTLQSNYLQQISSLAEKILSELAPMVYKHQLLTLLLAHRNIVVKMITIYQEADVVAGEKNILKATNTLVNIRSSLKQIATCLDFLNCNPFLHWLGVDPRLNPLLFKKKINGSKANFDHTNMAVELIVNNDDENILLRSNDVLWDIYYYESHGNSKSVKFKETYDHSEHGENGYKPLKESWETWRWAYICQRKLKEYRVAIEMQRKRKIFQGFERYFWVNCRIKVMLTKRNKKLLVMMIMHWQLYTGWCHRYHQLHNRSLQSIKRICLHKLHDYTKEHHETRVWKTSVNRILMKKYFKDLKTFTKLSKHELKNRLKKGTILTLDDKNLLKYTYDRWSRRIKTVGKLSGLEELILYNNTRKAFCTWKQNTNIGRSIILTAVKQILKDKVIDLHGFTKEQTRSIYEYTKVKAKEAKSQAHANLKSGNKILSKKLQQLSKRVKGKIEDTYNNHFNTSNVRKRLFAISGNDDESEDIINTVTNRIDDNIEQGLTTELKEEKERARKLRLRTSIKLAKAKANSLRNIYENSPNSSITNEQQLMSFHVIAENDKISFLK